MTGGSVSLRHVTILFLLTYVVCRYLGYWDKELTSDTDQQIHSKVNSPLKDIINTF